VQFGRNVVGELLDRGVEELNPEQDKQYADHGDVPGRARRHDKAKRQRQDKGDDFLADRGFGPEAVADRAQRIYGGVENPLQGIDQVSGMAPGNRAILYLAYSSCARHVGRRANATGLAVFQPFDRPV
jgi:hypothetical protein